MIKYSKDKEEMGARIQEIRLKRNMTQEELSEKAGICNAQQMSNIERGLAGLSIERFKDICTALDIEADYLLFGLSLKNAETILSKYITKMTPEQLNFLTDLIKLYGTHCGIDA